MTPQDIVVSVFICHYITILDTPLSKLPIASFFVIIFDF